MSFKCGSSTHILTMALLMTRLAGKLSASIFIWAEIDIRELIEQRNIRRSEGGFVEYWWYVLRSQKYGNKYVWFDHKKQLWSPRAGLNPCLRLQHDTTGKIILGNQGYFVGRWCGAGRQDSSPAQAGDVCWWWHMCWRGVAGNCSDHRTPVAARTRSRPHQPSRQW